MKEVARISLKTMGWRRKAGLVLVTCGIIFPLPYLEEWLGINTVLYDLQGALVFLGQLVGCAILVTIMHEGLHGIFFRRYTGKVKFGVKFDKIFWILPYATSPGCKLSRGQLVRVALAPQMATVILLVASLSVSPEGVLPRLLFWGAMFNFVGGVLDIYMSIWLLRFKSSILIEDTIDGAVIYEEAK